MKEKVTPTTIEEKAQLLVSQAIQMYLEGKPTTERRNKVVDFFGKELAKIAMEEALGCVGENTNFTKDGKPKMCWRCSYWGKDCKCYHNELLEEIRERIKEAFGGEVN